MKSALRLFTYLAYIIFVGVLYYYEKFLLNEMKLFLSLRYFYLFMFFLYPIMIGCLLGIIGLIPKLKAGGLKYDWIMALGLGLPFVYDITASILFWQNIRLPSLSLDYPLAGIVFGVILVSAFKAVPSEESIEQSGTETRTEASHEFRN